MGLASFAILSLLAFLPNGTAEAPVLQPPRGSKVAIVVFEDLQCPECARTSVIVKEQARIHNIPVVRHDFPLPRHDWAQDAAVLARYFDTKNVGDQFRDYVFLYQAQITRENLRGRAEEFAARNHLSLPKTVDPGGELAAKVRADFDFGRSLGINHTPTVFIVGSRPGQAAVEVVDLLRLSTTIEAMMGTNRLTHFKAGHHEK
jgi:protein-disulfide isomerase